MAQNDVLSSIFGGFVGGFLHHALYIRPEQLKGLPSAFATPIEDISHLLTGGSSAPAAASPVSTLIQGELQKVLTPVLTQLEAHNAWIAQILPLVQQLIPGAATAAPLQPVAGTNTILATLITQIEQEVQTAVIPIFQQLEKHNSVLEEIMRILTAISTPQTSGQPLAAAAPAVTKAAPVAPTAPALSVSTDGTDSQTPGFGAVGPADALQMTTGAEG